MAFALDTAHPLYPFIREAIGVDPVTKQLTALKGTVTFTYGGNYSAPAQNTAYGYPARLRKSDGYDSTVRMPTPLKMKSVESTVFMVLGNTPAIVTEPNRNTILDAAFRGNIVVDSTGKLTMQDSGESQGVPFIVSNTTVGSLPLYTAAITIAGSNPLGATHKIYVDGALDVTGAARRANEDFYSPATLRDYGAIAQSEGGFSGGQADLYWLIVFDRVLTDAEILSLHNGIGGLNTSSLLEGGVAELPTVTGVVITGGDVTVTGSESRTFTATVQGTNNPSQAVTWTASAGTINSSTGAFTAPFATAGTQTITVTATSVDDATKSDSITVTVSAAGVVTPVNVTGISVTPRQAEVLGGQQLQLVVNVAGTGNPSQAVTWVVSGGSVSATGVWTAPAATGSATTYTVTATSQANPTYSASVVLIVPAVAAAGQFLTDRMINNAGTALGNASIAWTWVPGRQVGGIAGATLVEGTGNTDALGQLLVTGLPAGAGILLAKSGSAVFYQEGLVA